MRLEGLNDDFRDFLVALVDTGVEFVVVGAYALAFHGAPRASGDIDVFVKASAANAARLIEALRLFGAPVGAGGVASSDLSAPGIVYQIGLPPRRIDVMTQITGVTFEEAWASRVTAEVEGRAVGFIGRDALLKNKEATGRLKDRADVERLRRRPPTPRG
jgi:hypothetical protein